VKAFVLRHSFPKLQNAPANHIEARILLIDQQAARDPEELPDAKRLEENAERVNRALQSYPMPSICARPNDPKREWPPPIFDSPAQR
jgi:hypothetical protein